jgi:hypothetical protein
MKFEGVLTEALNLSPFGVGGGNIKQER